MSRLTIIDIDPIQMVSTCAVNNKNVCEPSQFLPKEVYKMFESL